MQVDEGHKFFAHVYRLATVLRPVRDDSTLDPYLVTPKRPKTQEESPTKQERRAASNSDWSPKAEKRNHLKAGDGSVVVLQQVELQARFTDERTS